MVSFNCLCLISREKTAKPSDSFLSPIYFFLWELQFFLAVVFLLNPWASVTISTITILSVLLLILCYLSSWTFSDFYNFLCETSRVTQLCWTKLGLGLPKAGPQGWMLQCVHLAVNREIYSLSVCTVLNSINKKVLICLSEALWLAVEAARGKKIIK